MTVVRHPQVAAPGPVPVAEQHRQGAPSGREGYRFGIRGDTVLRPHQLRCRRRSRSAGRGSYPGRLPNASVGSVRRASHLALNAVVQGVTAVVPPCLVGTFEAAVAKAAQEHVLAVPQDGEVDVRRLRRCPRDRAPTTLVRSVTASGISTNRSSPPTGLSSAIERARVSCRRRGSRSGRPSSSQSNAATPLPRRT